MKFKVNGFFSDKVRIASCAFCGTLIGFSEEDVHVFTSDTHPKEIHALTCPECDGFLLLDYSFKD